ncbi:hypothetical protein ACE02G_20060 [Shewanella xiamenensis]|uniref:hypothetical protein n=1 Tax=Shewanella xiamenensis TaxID=332186 RepID=UPI0035B8E0F6
MKWIILLAAVGGVFWAANWSYHLLDNAILITDYWKAQGNVEWGMVHFKAQPENAEVYAFKSVQGYWGILKSLWPIFTLFILVFCVLIPVTIYISNALTKLQITRANEAKKQAEEQAANAALQAEKHEIKMNRWADEKVQNAQAEARTKAKAELTLQIQKLQADQLNLQEREAAISAREQATLDAESAAKKQVDQIIEQYRQELARFETELSAMQKSKNQAQQGFKRIKQKSLRQS